MEDSRMKSTSTIFNSIKTTLFIVLATTIVLFLLPALILNRAASGMLSFGMFRYLAILFWSGGGILLIWAARDFVIRGSGTPIPTDPPKSLVIHGFYRYTRNPMYLGVLSALLGHFLWFQSLWLLLFLGFVFFVFHTGVRIYEEPTLHKLFGKAYQEYQNSVPRWLF